MNEIAEEEGGEYYVIPEGDVQLDQDKTKFSENQPQVVNNGETLLKRDWCHIIDVIYVSCILIQSSH